MNKRLKPLPFGMTMVLPIRLQEHVVEYLDDMLEPGELQHSEPEGDETEDAAAGMQQVGSKREVYAK
jgi:hypothetical protein